MVNCIENLGCLPQNPLDVLNIFDVWFGAGMSLLAMALILGTITLGIYEIAAFGSIITSKYISSQYQIAIYVMGIGIATAVIMLVLRLVKE